MSRATRIAWGLGLLAAAAGIIGFTPAVVERLRATAEADRAAAEVDRRACDRGEADGCTNLGVLYEDGKGVPQDQAQAAAYYRRGCEGGSTQGCDLAKDLTHQTAQWKPPPGPARGPGSPGHQEFRPPRP